MGSRWRRRFGVAAAALVLGSCAGPRVELEHGVFRAPRLFRVTVPGPEGTGEWAVEGASETELALRHGPTRAGLFANAECGAEPARRDLALLAQRLFIGLRGREVLGE